MMDIIAVSCHQLVIVVDTEGWGCWEVHWQWEWTKTWDRLAGKHVLVKMPLEPVPPPSPMEKLSPPLKHRCNCSSATCCCDIPISQIGRHFHFIPKTFINMVFFPPAIPTWVLCLVKAHPPHLDLNTQGWPEGWHYPNCPNSHHPLLQQ